MLVIFIRNANINLISNNHCYILFSSNTKEFLYSFLKNNYNLKTCWVTLHSCQFMNYYTNTLLRKELLVYKQVQTERLGK